VGCSAVFAVVLIATLRKPFSAPSDRKYAKLREKELRESRERADLAPAFPTPPLPAPNAGKSKEEARA
jgi:NADH-quinone oxidoreductase subunit H